MFLMSRKIRAMGVKMVLSGEGADEAFGGYTRAHPRPNAHTHKLVHTPAHTRARAACVRSDRTDARQRGRLGTVAAAASTGRYLYFHKCPNKEEFHRETVRTKE